MKLIYHPISPYSRKVYMLALELNLDSQIALEQVIVAPIPYPGWSDNNDHVATFNPMAKIPTLVVDDPDGGETMGIFDSRVICEYLESLARRAGDGKRKIEWVEKTIHACSDGMLDAEVLVVYEERIRAERNLLFQAWIDGQREKIRRGFDFLEKQARDDALRMREHDKDASTAEIAVAATIGFMEMRDVEWKERRPCLAMWFEKWKERESFKGTDSRFDWKRGAKVGDLGFKAFEYPK